MSSSLKIFLCFCALILLFGICARYFTWRDTEYLAKEEVVEVTDTFVVN